SLDRFENGDPISRPRLSQAGNLSPNAEPSDYWLMNSQYLRLKNVEIAYTFSGKDFLKRYGLNYLRIFANGNNLLTFSPMQNFDPERGSGNTFVYPLMRVYNFGLNLQF